MAKDQLRHGSNARGTGAQGMRLVKTHVLGAHSAKVYKNPEWGEIVVKTFRDGVYQPKNDYHTDDMADAHGTAMSQLNRWGDQSAKASLASGPKSAAAPVHDSMSGIAKSEATLRGMNEEAVKAGVTPRQGFGNTKIQSPAYNEHGSRHGYSPDAVNAAIASSNRAGRRIGGREAKMIHALLKGR